MGVYLVEIVRAPLHAANFPIIRVLMVQIINELIAAGGGQVEIGFRRNSRLSMWESLEVAFEQSTPGPSNWDLFLTVVGWLVGWLMSFTLTPRNETKTLSKLISLWGYLRKEVRFSKF
jgi:hypothetical protein